MRSGIRIPHGLIRPTSRTAVAVLAAVVLVSCGSSDKGGGNKSFGGYDDKKLASRIMSKPSLDKRSMYDRNDDAAGGNKTVHTGMFAKKEYRKDAFKGSKEYKKQPYSNRDQRSPWAGMTSRESAQEVSSNLRESYGTGESRFADKTSRDAGETYGTGTYRTNQNRMGTEGLENSSSPRAVPGINTTQGLSEGDIKTLLGKD